MKRPLGRKAILYKTILVVSAVFFLWALWVRLDDGFNLDFPILIFCSFVLTVIFGLLIYNDNGIKILSSLRRRLGWQWLDKISFSRLLFSIAIIVGIALRLLFLTFNDAYQPFGKTTDTGIHWHAAQEIAQNGQIQDAELGKYEATFPYLTSYTSIVALSIKIFGPNYLAVLLPNIVFDLISLISIYILLFRWKGKHVAILGGIIWFLNPICILFCGTGVALTVVNMFISVALLLFYLMIKSLESYQMRRFIILVVLAGIWIALGNSIRSIFTVLGIAFIVTILLFCLYSRPAKKRFLTILASIALFFVMFFGTQAVVDRSYQIVNPYYTEVGQSNIGWSFFVGANYNEKGQWSHADWQKLWPQIYGEHVFDDGWTPSDDAGAVSPATLHHNFMQLGINRYQEMSISNIFIHLINKTDIMFGEGRQRSTWNITEQFRDVPGDVRWYLCAQSLGSLCLTYCLAAASWFFLQLLCHKSFFSSDTTNIDYVLLFLALVFCGLFASSLLVEVMSRYISIFLPIFAIFAACAFPKKPQPKVGAAE